MIKLSKPYIVDNLLPSSSSSQLVKLSYQPLQLLKLYKVLLSSLSQNSYQEPADITV